jgi:hypothetical protein
MASTSWAPGCAFPRLPICRSPDRIESTLLEKSVRRWGCWMIPVIEISP